MLTEHRPAVMIFLGGLALAICGMQFAMTNLPRPWAPYPLATVMPGLLAERYWVTPFLPIVLFWVLSSGLFRGATNVPLVTWVAVLILGGLNVVYIGLSWTYGVAYQGHSHTVVVTMLSVVAFIASASMLLVARRVMSFGLTLAANWVFCFWVGWFAFPYLGELP